MKTIRTDRKYILLKDTETNLYTVERRRDQKRSKWMTNDEAEGLILDDTRIWKAELSRLAFG